MRVRIKAKTEKGTEAVKKFYESKNIVLRMIGGHVQLIEEKPYTIELQHRQWNSLSKEQANDLYVYAPVVKIICSRFNVEESDFEVKCV